MSDRDVRTYCGVGARAVGGVSRVWIRVEREVEWSSSDIAGA